MNPEQPSMGPLPVQSDPDSSQPDAEPGQRTLKQRSVGAATVKTIGARMARRQQINTKRRFARPVRGQLTGGADNLRGQDDHQWRQAA